MGDGRVAARGRPSLALPRVLLSASRRGGRQPPLCVVWSAPRPCVPTEVRAYSSSGRRSSGPPNSISPFWITGSVVGRGGAAGAAATAPGAAPAGGAGGTYGV